MAVYSGKKFTCAVFVVALVESKILKGVQFQGRQVGITRCTSMFQSDSILSNMQISKHEMMGRKKASTNVVYLKHGKTM